MADDRRVGDGFREGVRTGMEVLAAFKEVIEETIEDLKKRGDLSPERGREAVRSAMDRAAVVLGDARERFDFVPRRDLDALKSEVTELRRRLAGLEEQCSGEPGGDEGE